MKYVSVFCLLLTLLVSTVSLATEIEKSITPSPAIPKITINADDQSVKEVFESISKQSGQKIVLESVVKGNIKLLFTDVDLQTAITTVCKVKKLEWRKISINPSDAKLLEQPDKLTATLRLIAGMGFPDIIMNESSSGKVFVHTNGKDSLQSIQEPIIKTLKMMTVYVITDEAAMAAKSEAEKKSAAVDKFAEISKEQMDMFMQMTPEEREQAMMASLNLYEQMDPSYMAKYMQSFMNTDRDKLKQMMNRQTEMLFSMAPEDRRAMMKLQMQLQTTMTPEQIQILQEDARSVMEELQQEKGNN